MWGEIKGVTNFCNKIENKVAFFSVSQRVIKPTGTGLDLWYEWRDGISSDDAVE